MTRLLVSVRNVDEARLAARHGADFIDCKEPAEGALGGLPVDTIRAIVESLRAEPGGWALSATIGDVPLDDWPTIRARVQAVAAARVDYVKVGVSRGPQARAVLDSLAALDAAVVPVFIADAGLDFEAVAHAGALRFPALMVDTADKAAGSLLERVPPAELARFVCEARRHGAMAGLAGALRAEDAPALKAMGCDFAGFRSAVCEAGRASALSIQRLETLARLMREPPR